MKKRYFVYLLLFFVLIFLIFLIKNNYKNIKNGNNYFDKSVRGIEEYILNINSYRATIEVVVNSNKNQNKYLIEQEHTNGFSKQIVQEPENISGVEIISKDGKIEIKNTKLNLSEMYNEYSGIYENILWLDSFIELYKTSDNKKIYEENGYIVMELHEENNKYYYNRKLYINKESGAPEKMIVQDNSNNEKIYILYKKIIINK